MPTVIPEELLALETSGATEIAGGNFSFEQPLNATGSPFAFSVIASFSTYLPGSW